MHCTKRVKLQGKWQKFSLQWLDNQINASWCCKLRMIGTFWRKGEIFVQQYTISRMCMSVSREYRDWVVPERNALDFLLFLEWWICSFEDFYVVIVLYTKICAFNFFTNSLDLKVSSRSTALTSFFTFPTTFFYLKYS